jgi:hypothetical protein
VATPAPSPAAPAADKEFMESFLGDTYGHYDEHFASIQKFVAQQAK